MRRAGDNGVSGSTMHHSISSVARNADAPSADCSGGQQTVLPYFWPRDNCGCSECRVAQTTEKRFHLFRIAKDLRPLQVGIERAGSEDEAISTAWPDGHRTRYRSSEIHGLLSRPRWSLLKRAHKGTFHKLSPKHLDRSVQEFAGRHNMREQDSIDMMRSMADGMDGKRLAYKALIAPNGLPSGARQ